MATSRDSLLAAAHGLQRGETVLAFRARMEALLELEAALRAGVLPATEAALQLRELMLGDTEAACDVLTREGRSKEEG